MKLGVLFSGGKDSAFACMRAMEKEEVTCLITVLPTNPESYLFHTPNIDLTPLQARAAGLPLVSVESGGIEEAEVADLCRALSLAVEKHGIEGVVTGAIHSVYQATRIQKACHDLDLWCFNPLWQREQEDYLEEVVSRGFRFLISGVFAAPFDEAWLGREVDRRAADELKTLARRHRMNPAGEGGEYETFVFDAPFFRKRIEVLRASRVYRGDHGIFRIEEARLVAR
ncbi:MAG: diphthine--ammonia ligase [Methanomicrobiales archaeon]|nr:diphthine--ammonia ligase [Methanomicrobiales archaeon]MDD1671361.1 diphthine--ammonia ligase [Methanomicrobiales archaeon]